MPLNYPGEYHEAALAASHDEQWDEGERKALAALAARDPEYAGHSYNTPGSPYWKRPAGSGAIIGYAGHGFLFHAAANGTTNIAIAAATGRAKRA